MQDTMTLDSLQELRGKPVFADDGDKIGSVEEIFYDEESNRPEWIGIGSGFFGTKRVLVPAARASLTGDGLRVPFAKEHVKDSPDIDSDEISTETERDLYAYYGLAYSESRSDTGLPAGDTGSGEAAVTRSEEELRVGTRGVETGRVRLRKWVETEPVAVDVELQQEAARVTRERIDQPVSGAEIGSEEIEVPLRGEEAVVQKQAVAKEKIAVGKTVETEQETVSDEVRKERVEVDEDGSGRR